MLRLSSPSIEMADAPTDTRLSDDVRKTARTWNFDSYLAATLAPADVQNDLIALAAFVGELERICQTVSEPALMQIRVQWWRDELQRIARDKTSDHPIGASLVDAAARHDLPIGLLIGIADAVADQLSGLNFSDDHLLSVWFAKRYAAPVELAARCLGAEIDGRAVSLAGRVCGLSSLVTRTRSGIDLKEAFGITGTEDELATEMATTLDQLIDRVKTKPRVARVPFLPASLAGVDVRAQNGPVGPLRRLLKITSAHWLGRF